MDTKYSRNGSEHRYRSREAAKPSGEKKTRPGNTIFSGRLAATQTKHLKILNIKRIKYVGGLYF
jgi:hypothetical protein